MEGYKKGGQPNIAWWLRQIRHGLRFRQEKAFEKKWPQWRNMYRGEWRGDVLPSNIFFKMVRTIVPRIYFRNPSVSVVAKKPGTENFILAKLLERTDNKLIRQMQLKKHIKRQVQDTFMFGTGIGKLGFGSQFHSTFETLGSTEAPRASKGKESVEYNFDLMPNMPWYARWPTDGYVLPAGTVWREDARWEVFITRRPLSDIKVDKRLSNTSDLTANRALLEPLDRRGFDKKDPVEMAELYEIRDKKSGKVFVISPVHSEKPLFMEDDGFLELGIEVGNALIFNEDDEAFWGIPDSQILEPLQRELNEIRTITMYHRRISIIKMLVQRNAIKPEEAAKMLNADVGAIVWTEEPPDTAVKIIQAGQIPNDLFASEAAVLGDVRETVGFSRNEFGEFKPGRESATATEAQIVKLASEIRIDERRDMVADMIVTIMNDVNKIIFNNWDEELVQEVVGPGGVPIWVQFRPSILKRGVYDVAVDPDQTTPLTKDVREQKALILYERLKTNPLIDPFELTKYLLHELHGVAFDDMMRGIPQGQGMSQERPLSVGGFQQVLKNVEEKAPQIAPNTGGPEGRAKPRAVK